MYFRFLLFLDRFNLSFQILLIHLEALDLVVELVYLVAQVASCVLEDVV